MAAPSRQRASRAERAALVVAGVAFAMSAAALFAYARDVAGFPAVTAAGMPVILDALVLVAGWIALDREDDGDRPGLAGLVFWSAIAVSWSANYAHAVPTIRPADLGELAAGLLAGTPPLALAAAYELVVRERRRKRRHTATAPAAVAAGPDLASAAAAALSPLPDADVGERPALSVPADGPDREPDAGAGERPALSAGDDIPLAGDPVAAVVAAHLESGGQVTDPALTGLVAARLGVTERTARRRLAPHRAHAGTAAA